MLPVDAQVILAPCLTMASSSAASGSCAGLPRESKAAPSTEDTPAETRNLENTQNKAAVQVQVDGSLNASPQGFASRTVLNAEDDAIDEALPILPKGFVENTAEIYSEVASFDVIPAEKLREYWRGENSLYHVVPSSYGGLVGN